MADCEERATSAEHAERLARAWLAARSDLELVDRPPKSDVYGLKLDERWVFRLPDLRFMGASRYLAVNRFTGHVTELQIGE